MSRRRYLSTTISTDTAVNRLAMQYGDFAALLYTWLIPHAADDCSFPADPEELMMIVMPGRRDKQPADIQAAIEAMLGEGLILHDPDNPNALMFPPKSFYRHQTYIKEERQRKTPQNSAVPETTGDMPQTGASRAYASSSVSVPSSSSVSVSSSPPDVGEENVAPAARVRSVDLLFESVVDACYHKPFGEITDDERNRVNKALPQLRKLHALPVDVYQRAEEYRLRSPGMSFTPQTLTKCWTDLAKHREPARASPTRNGGLTPAEILNLNRPDTNIVDANWRER